MSSLSNLSNIWLTKKFEIKNCFKNCLKMCAHFVVPLKESPRRKIGHIGMDPVII